MKLTQLTITANEIRIEPIMFDSMNKANKFVEYIEQNKDSLPETILLEYDKIKYLKSDKQIKKHFEKFFKVHKKKY